MPDIQYLLLLQNFRNATNDLFTPFAERISLFAVTYLIMIPVFIYWVVDKHKGLYALASYYLCCGFNAVVKLTACIYRPWIRDPRILPAGNAIQTATGYSFPSGHTSTAGPIYGGIAVGYRKKLPVLSVICLIALALTAFSRNYLGVHTPQDVLVALLESALSLYFMAKIFDYLHDHPEKEKLFLIGMFIFGWLAIIYITFKPYPMTYIDGKLLVDPQRMMNDGYGDTSLLIAFPLARTIEHKWVRFRAAGVSAKGILIGMIGSIPLFIMLKYMRHVLDGMLGSHWGHFMNSFILVLYCIAIFPIVISLVCGREDRKELPG